MHENCEFCFNPLPFVSQLVWKFKVINTAISGAMSTLASELVPDNDISVPSPTYRKMVACSLLYKVKGLFHGIGN